MNDLSYTHSTTPTRTRKPATERRFRASIQEAGASRLSADEIAIVTKALLILENKVMRTCESSSPENLEEPATCERVADIAL